MLIGFVCFVTNVIAVACHSQGLVFTVISPTSKFRQSFFRRIKFLFATTNSYKNFHW